MTIAMCTVPTIPRRMEGWGGWQKIEGASQGHHKKTYRFTGFTETEAVLCRVEMCAELLKKGAKHTVFQDQPYIKKDFTS